MGEDICKLTIINGFKRLVRDVEPGMNLYKALVSEKSELYSFQAPCGGKGTCGKCKVKLKGQVSEPTDHEIAKLSSKELESGIRLACQVTIIGDIWVEILHDYKKASIQVEGLPVNVDLSPLARREHIHIPSARLEEPKDDVQRLLHALGRDNLKIRMPVLTKLSEVLNGSDQDLCATVANNTVIDIYPDDSAIDYGFAVDIGTTTVVGYLVNLFTGKVEATISQINAQKAYGADVLSRISFSMENPGGHKVLHQIIVEQLDLMLQELVSRHGISKESVCAMAMAGNTTMMHFLMGLKPDRIAKAPFTPVLTSALTCSAGEIGFSYHPNCPVYLLPSISGYVGADIVAGMLACSLRDKNRIQLLVDIGTNGEMALSKYGEIMCCSVAAGPAFEGARIQCGIGGVEGAIDSAWIENGKFYYHTLNDRKPIGICGSGLVDAIAVLVEYGIVDEGGRFTDTEEWDPRVIGLSDRIQDINGEKAFVVALANDTSHGEPIYISQKDIREVQLAKAAVHAGIITLLHHQELRFEDIDAVWLAGGFGNKIRKESAVTIGLLPRELLTKIQFAGNTSGTGAMMALLSGDSRAECDIIKKESRYLELSGLAFFNDAFINAIGF